jgi:threonine dehydratase
VLPSREEIQEARNRIDGIARRTPLVRLDCPDLPPEIWLKLECLQPIGSFKIRGAANAMARIPPAGLARGVVTASAGNMAQGVAWCARERGVPCTVIAPDTAPAAKLAATERLGARIVQVPFDRWWKTFQERCYPGVSGTFVHAFDDPHVMAGNGTIGLEIIEELPDASAVVIPWGGGGLTCGIGVALRAVAPQCRIFTAEAETAAPFAAALASGASTPVDYRPSFVDGIGSRQVLPQMLDHARALVDGAIVASLEQIAAAMRLIAERARVVTEGAGACSLAAALSGRAGSGRVVCIVSGGNIDLDVFARLVAGARPA